VSALEDVDACAQVMEVMTSGMIVNGWPTGGTYRSESDEFVIHTPDGRALGITVEDVTG
jgi:hypothetical protein